MELQEPDNVNDENPPIKHSHRGHSNSNEVDVMYLPDFVVFSFDFIQFRLVILFQVNQRVYVEL
jgi:hypothetical protein